MITIIRKLLAEAQRHQENTPERTDLLQDWANQLTEILAEFENDKTGELIAIAQEMRAEAQRLVWNEAAWADQLPVWAVKLTQIAANFDTIT
jgi:hypothetical protein